MPARKTTATTKAPATAKAAPKAAAKAPAKAAATAPKKAPAKAAPAQNNPLMDAWNKGRTNSKSNSETNVPVGNDYIGKLIAAKTINTNAGAKSKLTFQVFEPAEYNTGDFKITRWSGPYDDPNNQNGIDYWMKDFRNMGVDVDDDGFTPDVVNDEFYQALIDRNTCCRLAVAPANDGIHTNEYINGPWDDGGAMGTEAPAAAAADETVEEEVVEETTEEVVEEEVVEEGGEVSIEEGDSVKFVTSKGDRAGVVKGFESVGGVENSHIKIRDDEDGKTYKVAFDEKVELLAS